MGGMTGSLLLLLWAGVSVSTMVDLQKRIIHGHDCNNNERQYHVQLNIKTQTGRALCGASLISDQWILTARHCWEPGETISAILRVHPHGNEITETINLNNIHQYDKADIMLLKLTTPRPGFIQIALPDCVNHPTPKNVMVQIAGHGAITAAPDKTRTPYRVPDLKCADIKVNNCPGVKKYDELFCGKTTDKTSPVDSCLGDSGGGVVYKEWIYGVISRGHQKACTGPDKYVGVCGYMSWITSITGITTSKPPKNILNRVRNVFKSG
uniref:Anionic trypsin-2-like n=1 Tax=Sparus aurata TaxID=8175 RepID=A0A671WYN7_SPAAU